MSALFKEEEELFTNYLNYFLDDIISTNKESDLSSQISYGIIVAKFINIIKPNIIDVRAINQPNTILTTREMIQNQNLNIWAAKVIGLQTTITVQDLVKRDNKGLKFSFLLALIKTHLFQSINEKTYPLEVMNLFTTEIYLMMQLKKFSAEHILKKWVNFHLTKQKYSKQMFNFGKDLKDGTILTILFRSITGNNNRNHIDIINVANLRGKLKQDLNKLGRKIFFLSTKFKSNEKFNTCLVAELFHWGSCAKIGKIDVLVYGYCRSQNMPNDIIDLIITWSKGPESIHSDKKINNNDTQEAMLIKWINSLSIRLTVGERGFLLNCCNGLLLLKIINVIEPGYVNWKRIKRHPMNIFKKLSNANYVVTLAKKLQLPVVSMGAADIVNMNKHIVLGLVWQLMRYYMMKSLGFKYNRHTIMTEVNLLNICNECIMDSAVTVKPQITSFDDDVCLSGVYCISLASAVSGLDVNWKCVKQNAVKNSDKISNTNYGISLSIMAGCDMLVTATDIVHGNSKMRLVFCGYLMIGSRRSA